MKKFILILLLILAIPMFSYVAYQHDYLYFPTTADSGFDSDYGDYDGGGSWGGDYGGGGSWDDDDDYDNDYDYNSNRNYSGGPIDSSLLLLAFLIIAIAITTPFVINAAANALKNRIQRNRAIKNRIHETLFNEYGLFPGKGCDSEFIQAIFQSYVKIQLAWMNRDLSSVRHLLTDEIYNMYQMQVETLIEDNQINVMSDFELVCGKLKSKRTSNNIETLKVILCVNCKDYIKTANSNKVIKGDKRATITYIYELTFLRDVNSNKTTNCPSCGAEVKKQMSTNCPYCKNLLLLTSATPTMSNKLILHQYKR